MCESGPDIGSLVWTSPELAVTRITTEAERLKPELQYNSPKIVLKCLRLFVFIYLILFVYICIYLYIFVLLDKIDINLLYT